MTITVIARDPHCNLLGIAQASNPLSVGGRCPFIRSNLGAICTQAFTDPGLGAIGLELLAKGYSPDEVLRELRASDLHYEHRQVGIIDAKGGVAVYTGQKCCEFSDAKYGDNFIVMGNMLTSPEVVPNMHRSWLNSSGDLFEDRLLKAVIAGRDAGGDVGGHRSSCLIVHENETYARTDLRVDFVPKRANERDAVDTLEILLNHWRPLIEYYKFRPHDPTAPSWIEWLEQQGIPFHN